MHLHVKRTLCDLRSRQDLKSRIESVNRERKLQQTTAGRELVRCNSEWLELQRKNAEIEGACAALEEELYLLQVRNKKQPNVSAFEC